MNVNMERGRRRLAQKDGSATTSTATHNDHLVMATNNSSIVSKRSVERLYYPNETHFFRFFVNKFQRRAPLINRGYHLRLHVIDVILRDFLKRPSSKTKVVVNLGCGSDVIPWQCWTRYAQHCHDSRVVFVDVDFPDLIRKKRQIVLNTPELAYHLTGVHIGHGDEDHIALRSDRYYQIGCDLRYPFVLEEALSSILDLQDCVFKFVAEVSITYMETEAADALIQWASGIGDAEFCLLEQILPDGPSHPFAQTMLAHFHKLSTPIKSVTKYMTENQQHTRFVDRGWPSVRTQSLWSAWRDETFLAAAERRKLDEIEPFDEWEEFALFASHYLLLCASNYESPSSLKAEPSEKTCSVEVETDFRPLTGQQGLRRFGAAMAVLDSFGREAIINILGLGNTTRFPSYDTYMRENVPIELDMPHLGGPSSRMCFTLTDLGDYGFLLAGGRSSPAKAMNDCWFFSKSSCHWTRTFDLPVSLYRHSACRLSGSSLALMAGGRTMSTAVSDMFAVFHPAKGWLQCTVVSSFRPQATFGSILICTRSQAGMRPVYHGLLAGGLYEDGILNQRTFSWELSFGSDEAAPIIAFSQAKASDEETSRLLSRFGAAYAQTDGSLVVIGGIGRDGIISRDSEVVIFSTVDFNIRAIRRLALPCSMEAQVPRPLLVGSSVVLTRDNNIAIIGGAATCFSMGTFWTKGIYELDLTDVISKGGSQEPSSRDLGGWQFLRSGEIVQGRSSNIASGRTQSQAKRAAEIQQIKHVILGSATTFETVLDDGLPVVLKQLNIGPCIQRWSPDYFTKLLGEDRKVVVHESSVKNMDFNAKNFRYTPMAFGEFMEAIRQGKRMYLRALSPDAPADQAANLERDFPALTAEFALPPELALCADNIHSSVLRISGPVNMWLHYDVQANVYCQIYGSKRMLLFPPSDVTHMSFAPGASSSSIDVFGLLGSPALASTHPCEANLEPGDVLFIPPLWLHTATPCTDFSIAINVFFRSIDQKQYSAGRDVYGNRDLAAYEKGRQDITKISNSFNRVPMDVKQFYLLRLAEELMEKASN